MFKLTLFLTGAPSALRQSFCFQPSIHYTHTTDIKKRNKYMTPILEQVMFIRQYGMAIICVTGRDDLF
jgi:hypothetical protein